MYGEQNLKIVKMKKNKEWAWDKKHIELVMTNMPYDGQLEDMEKSKNARKRKKRKVIPT